MFIHLNVKSCFTLMNGFNKISNVLEKTARMKSNAVAITDINTMHTFYDFEMEALKKTKKSKALKRDTIHPIFGITFMVKAKYEEDEYFNLTLLAKNEVGYRNLISLSTIANTNHQQFAYLSYDELEKHCEGLFCLSGGEEGEVFDLVVRNRKDEAIELLKDLKRMFKDNLYLEVSNHFMREEEIFIESGIIDDALTLGIDYVATNNAYYLRKEDAQYRSLALSMNSELAQIKASEVDWIHKYASRHVDFNNEWYLKTENEMLKAFSKYLTRYPRLLENTVKIAEQCQCSVPIIKTFPEFPLPKGYTEESYFRELMLKGFDERFPDDSYFDKRFTRQDYLDRMEYEFETVKDMGFLGYLLIVQDYINFAKDDSVFEHPERYFPKNCYQDYSEIPEGILGKNYKIAVGPGRGSGAGSLLCYILGITNLEPLSLGLLFERFLNKERVSMPDIDTDFQNQHRHVIVEYVQAKYGFDHVSQIVTYNMLGLKSIIKNVGKVLGIPYFITDELSKNVPKKIREFVYLEEEDREEEREVEPTLEDLKTIPFFKERIDSHEDVAQLFKIGKLFDGLPSSTGKHACGVIIGPKALDNFVALMEVDGVLVSQFEKKAAESIGLLKMDFLGLITLDIEVETLRLIKEQHGIDIDLDTIPLDDEKTFELLQKGQSGKVFQLESQGMRNLLRKMGPTDMSHIIAIAALYRPGPMQFIDNYIEGMKNPSKVKYPHPLYENSAKETFGILVYQEQIMQVVQDMAGFTLGESDILRRGIGKKDKQYIDQMEEEFSKRCVDNGVPEQTAIEVYAMIKKFAEYGFNKSHSAAYALIAYETAYLKAHYPVEFMAANCTINADNKDKLIPCLAEIKAMDIEILPPSIKHSLSQFNVEEKDGKLAIRYGYEGIDRIGEDVAKTIETLSKSQTLYDFIKGYPYIRKNQLVNLIYSGAFDEFGSRKEMEEESSKILETIKYQNQIKEVYKTSILDDLEGEEKYDGMEYGFRERLNNEKKVLHCCISGHPLEQVRTVIKGYETLISDMKEMNNDEEAQILCQISSIKKIYAKKSGEPMAFLSIEDEFDFCEAVVFPKVFADIEHLIQEDSLLILTGRVQLKENDNGESSVSLIVNTVKTALSSPLRFFISHEDLKDLQSELLEMNGIAEIISIDTNKMKVRKEEFYVDYRKALNLFNDKHIDFKTGHFS